MSYSKSDLEDSYRRGVSDGRKEEADLVATLPEELRPLLAIRKLLAPNADDLVALVRELRLAGLVGKNCEKATTSDLCNGTKETP